MSNTSEDKIIHNKNRKLNGLFNRLFPFRDGIDMSKLLLTEEGIYSISKPVDSEIISSNIEKILGKNIIITDATANVGGNTISFAEKFKKVNAIEIDDVNFHVLKKNIKVYELNEKVDTIHNNYMFVFNKLKQDVVFIDPPWGGRGYKDLKVLDLGLRDGKNSMIYIGNIVRRIMTDRLAKMAVIKVPFNFSFDKFETMLKDYIIEKYSIGGYFIIQIYFKDIKA